jgi:hypothetical protein
MVAVQLRKILAVEDDPDVTKKWHPFADVQR